MNRNRRVTALAVVTTAIVASMFAACATSPTSPSNLPAGTHQSAIAAITGRGAGGVSVTPKAIPAGTFDAIISVQLERAAPSTTYFVQRAPEIGRTLGSDGVCQRAMSIAPWSSADAPAPAFITFPGDTPGSLRTITTSTTGSGSLDFEFLAPGIAAGTVFDVMFRIVDSEASPTTELRSGCFTVTVR